MVRASIVRLFTVACISTTAAATESPHVVLFLSDDHGYLDSSVYGTKVVRTPAMEKLAKDGATFTNMFVGAPTCVPSRAILMTGLMSARNGAEDNHSQIKPGIKTLPTLMKQQGYRLAAFGKTHYRPAAAYRDLLPPVKGSSIRGAGYLNNDLNPAAVEKFLQNRNKNDKLCLIVGSHSPHVRWPKNNDYDAKRVELPPTFVDTPETREYRTQYYTDVTLMDERLGKVYASVRRHLGDNVLFIYMSDHGAQWPFGKWNLYDAGIRVPMIAVWPGKLKPGSKSAAMLSSCDVLPTFLEIGGGKPLADLDGRSFADVLRGKTLKHRDHVFATHSGDKSMNVYPMRAVRTARFKYIRNLYSKFKYTTHIDRGRNPDGRKFWDSWERAAKLSKQAKQIVARYHRRPAEELYDIVADPHETKNLAAAPRHVKTVIALRAKVSAWMKQQRDKGKLFGKPHEFGEPPAPPADRPRLPRKPKANANR